MSYFNYRVVHRDGQYAIHEVFYNDDGSIEGATQDPVFPRGDSLEELIEDLERYRGANDLPALEYEAVTSPSKRGKRQKR